MADSYEKIQRDFENSRGARCYPPGIIPPVKAFREDLLRTESVRSSYEDSSLESSSNNNFQIDGDWIEFRVNLKDRQQIKTAINILKSALDDLD